MSRRINSELAVAALKMAIQNRKPGPGCIHHSDQGVQYCSNEYIEILDEWKFKVSMSRKGNCWDNAVMERFFLNLKMERVWQKDYANHEEAIQDVADYIVGFYNSRRLHSKLGNLPPNAFEQKLAIQQPIDVSEKT
jgi:transposase InsO family protein